MTVCKTRARLHELVDAMPVTGLEETKEVIRFLAEWYARQIDSPKPSSPVVFVLGTVGKAIVDPVYPATGDE